MSDVTAVDLMAPETATKLKTLRTIKVKHADVGQMSQIVRHLGLSVQFSVLPSSEMLVVIG